jgi:hypothetical protein
LPLSSELFASEDHVRVKYRKADPALWDGERFRNFSDKAQLLWLRLLTGPEATPVPGLVIARRGALTDAMRTSPRTFSAIWSELGDWVEADWSAGVIVLPGATEQEINRPTGTNQPVEWASYFLRGNVPRCALARAWQTRICSWLREVNPLYAESFDACSRVDVRPENPEISRKELPKRNESEPPDETKANPDPNRFQGTGNREDLNAESEENLITCASKYLPGQPGLTAQSDFADLALVAVEPQATAHLGRCTEQKQRARVLKHLRSATSVLEALNAARRRLDANARGSKPTFATLKFIAERLEDGHSVDDCLHVIAVCEAESKKNSKSYDYFDHKTPFRSDNFAVKHAKSVDGPDESAMDAESRRKLDF